MVRKLSLYVRTALDEGTLEVRDFKRAIHGVAGQQLEPEPSVAGTVERSYQDARRQPRVRRLRSAR
jgi:hypothetical protein